MISQLLLQAVLGFQNLWPSQQILFWLLVPAHLPFISSCCPNSLTLSVDHVWTHSFLWIHQLLWEAHERKQWWGGRDLCELQSCEAQGDRETPKLASHARKSIPPDGAHHLSKQHTWLKGWYWKKTEASWLGPSTTTERASPSVAMRAVCNLKATVS